MGRFFQSLNPDISAILDIAGGYYSDESVRRSGDDPAYAIDAGDGRKVTRMSHKDDELVTLQKQSVDGGLL